MRMSREMLEQLGRIVRPLALRMANAIGRGVVQLADDTGMLQRLQLGILAGETVEGKAGAEHFEPYGFTSVPLAGAEAVAIFPNGDRSHPIVIATPDRRYRPKNGEAGQVTMYHYNGAKVTMLASGDIQVTPKSGCKVVIAGAATGPTGEGVVVGTGIDPFTGQTYNTLGNASSTTFAKK